MPRYIDADALLEKLGQRLESQLNWCLYNHAKITQVFIDAIKDEPTADVAPKSEVENYKKVAEYQQKLAMDRYFEIKRLQEEIENLKDNNEHLAVMLEEAKQGVDGFPCVAYNKKHEKYQVIHKGKQGHIFASKLYRCRKEAENALAELKKEYTEEKDNES